MRYRQNLHGGYFTPKLFDNMHDPCMVISYMIQDIILSFIFVLKSVLAMC